MYCIYLSCTFSLVTESTSLLENYFLSSGWVDHPAELWLCQLTLQLFTVQALTVVVEEGGEPVPWPQLLVLCQLDGVQRGAGGGGGGGGGARRGRNIAGYRVWGQWGEHRVKYWHWIEVFVEVRLQAQLLNLLKEKIRTSSLIFFSLIRSSELI